MKMSLKAQDQKTGETGHRQGKLLPVVFADHDALAVRNAACKQPRNVSQNQEVSTLDLRRSTDSHQEDSFVMSEPDVLVSQ